MTPLRTTLALVIAAAVLWAAIRTPAGPPRGPRRVHTGPARPSSPLAHDSAPAERGKSGLAAPRPTASRALVSPPVLPEPTPEPLPSVEETRSVPVPPRAALPAIASATVEATCASESEIVGTGEVLVGPASRPGAPPAARPHTGEPGRALAGPPPAADPGRRALEGLGLDLEHPDEVLRRLVEEYRASLEATEPDTERMALVDQGMAGIVRNYPQTADALFTLFVQERHPAMGRYLAYLLRDARRVDQEPPLFLMAVADPDEGRRANALASIAPARNDAALEVLLVALQDPSPAVRLASAEAIEASLAARPGLRVGLDVEERLDEARDEETDEGVTAVLARLASRP